MAIVGDGATSVDGQASSIGVENYTGIIRCDGQEMIDNQRRSQRRETPRGTRATFGKGLVPDLVRREKMYPATLDTGRSHSNRSIFHYGRTLAAFALMYATISCIFTNPSGDRRADV